MKIANAPLRLLLPILFFFSLQNSGRTATLVSVTASNAKQEITIKSVEKTLGRKLSVSEKLAFPLIKRDISRGMDANAAAAHGDGASMAIAGFVTGLLSLLVFGLILGILGIVFSSIALKRLRTSGASGRGLAVAGLVLGIVGLVGWSILILVLIATA